MKKLALSILLIIGAMTMTSENTAAQTLFYSPKVDSLYKLVNQACVMDSICVNDTVLRCADLLKGDTVPIILCKDENGIVDHIGYCFLPDTIRMVNVPIIQFLEREMLELLTLKNIGSILNADPENDLMLFLDSIPISQEVLKNKKKMCSLLSKNNGIIINKINKYYSVIILCSNGQQLSFSFPADCELISGMDKKEQEIRLAFQLKNHVSKTIDSIMPSPDISYLQLLQDSVYRDSIYVEKGEEFSIPQINNDLFYFKNDSIYSLVSDTSLIALTFSNALLVPSANHYTIDVKHRMYGFVVQEYTVDSRDFNDYFSRGYQRYFGIETLDPESLSGTMILYNRNEEFIHLAYVTTTLDNLINGGKLNIELYSNIPQHNIISLY